MDQLNVNKQLILHLNPINFTKKNQDDPNAATTANTPQHPSDGDDVDTASNNVDTIQMASKNTTTV